MTGGVDDIELSSDGRHLVVCHDFRAQLWTVQPLAPVGPELVHDYRVFAHFCPDGQTLLTGSSYKVHCWSIPGGKEKAPIPLKHFESIVQLACCSSGQFFASAQIDGLVRVWAFPRSPTPELRFPIEGSRTYVRPSPDGRLLLPPGAGWWPNDLRRTQAFDIASGKPVGQFLDPGGLITDAALSPDGRTAATLAARAVLPSDRYLPVAPQGRGGKLQRWNWLTGQPIGDAISLPSDPRNVAFSPDGRHMVVLCGGGQGMLIDSLDGKVFKSFTHGGTTWSENSYSDVQFSPDGKTFATCGLVPAVRLWVTATGESKALPWSTETTAARPDFHLTAGIW